MYTLTMMCSLSAFGQKQITNQSLIWFGYFFSVPHANGHYSQYELQERRYINPGVQHQFLIRAHYHVPIKNSSWEYSLGGCVFFQSPNDPFAKDRLVVPELRPHLEFANKSKLGKFTIDERFRLEARYFHQTNAERTELEDGFSYSNLRFRYRITFSRVLFDLRKNGNFQLKLSNELHVNAGNNIVLNTFDQNRLYGGLSYATSPNLQFEVGYLNWFQQRPNGTYFDRDILRFTVYHKLKRA